jgi:hypothetical protein
MEPKLEVDVYVEHESSHWIATFVWEALSRPAGVSIRNQSVALTNNAIPDPNLELFQKSRESCSS